MAIHRLITNQAFQPDEISVLVAAFATAREKLGIEEQSDPLTELLAQEIIDLALSGVHDPERLSTLAVQVVTA
jgi:hypothetical protein